MKKKVIGLCSLLASPVGDLKTLLINVRLLQKKYSNEIDLHLVIVIYKGSQANPVVIRKLVPEEISYDILYFQDIQSMVAADDKSDPTLIKICNEFKSADKIFICPNAHILGTGRYREISKFNKPIILCTEYNFDDNPKLWKWDRAGWQVDKDHEHTLYPPAFDCYLEMGISAEHYVTHGIFLSKVEAEDQPLSNVETLDGIRLKKFFLPSQTESEYHENHDLYFGYFNQIVQEDYAQIHGGLETPIEFIKFCLYKTRFKKRKDVEVIDIVLPLKNDISVYSFEGLMRDLKKANSIVDPEAYTFEYYEKNEDGALHCTRVQGEGKQRVRIINPFPLDEQSMAALFKASDPFCLVTGDQTLSEALSHRKIPFYQTMEWKKRLKCELMASVESVVGEDSYLNRYFYACGNKYFPESVLYLIVTKVKRFFHDESKRNPHAHDKPTHVQPHIPKHGGFRGK